MDAGFHRAARDRKAGYNTHRDAPGGRANNCCLDGAVVDAECSHRGSRWVRRVCSQRSTVHT